MQKKIKFEKSLEYPLNEVVDNAFNVELLLTT